MVAISGGLDDVRVVAEAETARELVKLLWDEISVSPALCYIGGISWDDVWAAVHVLVGVFDKYPLGEGIDGNYPFSVTTASG